MGRESFRGHPGLILMLVSIPLIIMVFLVLLYVTQQKITVVQEENYQLRQQVEELEKENLLYKKAYELLLADAKRLSKIYGGEDRFIQEAADIRLTNTTKTITTFQEYVTQGIINLSCVPFIEVRPGATELIVVSSSPLMNPSLDVYIDARKVGAAQIGEESAFTIPEGTEEVALVSSSGSIEVVSLRVNGEDVLGQVDLGAAWNAFDCENIIEGTIISEPGAYRVRLAQA